MLPCIHPKSNAGLDPAVGSWSVHGLDDEVYAQGKAQGTELGKWCLPQLTKREDDDSCYSTTESVLCIVLMWTFDSDDSLFSEDVPVRIHNNWGSV
jgi:hypothetical protein